MRLRDKRVDVRKHFLPGLHGKMRKKFNVALRSLDRRDSGCTAISMEDIDKYGIDKVAELALDIAWKGCKAVYVSLDIDVLEAAFCPGTGTPDFGGMLPRELLRLLKLVTAPGICGMDVVEVSPPFDVSEITSLAASRCIINVLCNLALNKSLYKH